MGFELDDHTHDRRSPNQRRYFLLYFFTGSELFPFMAFVNLN